MGYKIKEIYYTLQGEGFHTGREAVFVRFSGCNLWTGREQDRDKAICQFCDTDFLGVDGTDGGNYNLQTLIPKIIEIWDEHHEKDTHPFIVCTGGEPALQMDQEFINECHKHKIEVAIETNGTQTLPEHIDWICVSPKAGTQIVVTKGDELKLVYPQENAMPEQYEQLDFTNFYLQAMDGVDIKHNLKSTHSYCDASKKWKISIQTHKILGIR